MLSASGLAVHPQGQVPDTSPESAGITEPGQLAGFDSRAGVVVVMQRATRLLLATDLLAFVPAREQPVEEPTLNFG